MSQTGKANSLQTTDTAANYVSDILRNLQMIAIYICWVEGEEQVGRKPAGNGSKKKLPKVEDWPLKVKAIHVLVKFTAYWKNSDVSRLD